MLLRNKIKIKSYKGQITSKTTTSSKSTESKCRSSKHKPFGNQPSNSSTESEYSIKTAFWNKYRP